ncbi:MAG: LacI family DNA-binding transcriptional regulator [Prolixibacteraceae bacterium]|nr:LacI family DNA-binding transcriptional regulator [Prolixibacteraceae bacterium]
MLVRKATIHDIAEQLKLSASTVSRALNNSSRISIKTRERVRNAAAELNYMPNHLAMNLRKGRGTTIGVIVPRLNRHFFSHAIAGVESVLNPTDYNLMICQTNEDYETEVKSLQTFINHRIDGIIMSVATGTRKTTHIETALNEGIPVVLFDRMIKNLEVDQVLNDNFTGAFEMTKHLIEQGYHKIFHFSGPLHLELYTDRLNGYLKALKEASIEYRDEWIFNDVLTRDKARMIAEELIKNKNIPDAIFAASDFSALGALLAFKEAGYLIPTQIGIAGFANEPFTELTSPSMTTLEQYSEELGRSAARMLIERMEYKIKGTAPNSVVFKPKLIIRDSTLRLQVKQFDK